MRAASDWDAPFYLKEGENLMQKLTISDIAKATGGTLKFSDNGGYQTSPLLRDEMGDTKITSVVTDSREVTGGALFIAIKGDNVDGHRFIKSAVENGAAAVVAQEVCDCGATVIEVSDTTKAYGDIARYYKEKHNLPTVSITGSVGKTTTKDMIYSAIAADRCAMKTEKNYNNHIGVPLTVLSIEKEHKTAVIEMGMNHFGEIDYLASIVKPDIAVITNIGMSHIANLGSQEGIFRAKMEITNYFDEHNVLIVNGDDKFLGTLKQEDLKYKLVTYGVSDPECDVTAHNIISHGLDGVECDIIVDSSEYHVYIDIPGVHNVYNALAAVTAARELGIAPETAIYGIEHVELTGGRLEIVDVNGMKIIKDYYNASPDSVKSALGILSCATQERKAAILGDILEMGEYAKNAHVDLGDEVVKNKIDLLITAGENANYIADRAKSLGMENVHAFGTTDEAAEFAKTALTTGDAVLIKASHGMHFEKVFDAISEK